MFTGIPWTRKQLASTTAQVNFIASLVHATGWTTLKLRPKDQSVKKGTKRLLKEESEQPLLDGSRKKARSSGSGGQKRERPDVPELPNGQLAEAPVRKRCRGKQAESNAWVDRIVKKAEAKAKLRGRPKGSKSKDPQEPKVKIDRDGKSSSLTIWQKMDIIKEYEQLKKSGTIKNVQSYMLRNGRMKGGYQGCLSESKWLGARKKYKWDEFIQHCPKLSQKFKEVPNPILEVLGLSVPWQKLKF